MKIPFVDLNRIHDSLKKEILDEISNLFEDSSFILGNRVSEFESNISKFLGADCLSCASGSDALLLSLMASGIGQGDEVITTPFTFFATAGAIARLGAKPVFVDIDETLNIDVRKIEEKITSRTKAIIAVHIFGQACDMVSINSIAQKYNLVVIEDACQAIGAKFEDKYVGTIGDFGCFSFFPTKNLGGAGDGGLVVVKSYDNFSLVKKLRVHGSAKKYIHDVVGINSRLDAIQAVILNIKLKYLNVYNEERIKIARRYFEELKGVEFPKILSNVKHVFHQFSILVEEEKRDLLIEYLNENGIGAGVYYPKPLHLQECFEVYDYKQGDMPVCEDVCKRVLSLPIFPGMKDEEIDFIIEKVNCFFKNGYVD